MDLVYTIAGGTANYRRSPLQRALRDIHAVTQHIGAAPQQYEEAGRLLLGLEPCQADAALVKGCTRARAKPYVRTRRRTRKRCMPSGR
mgnify:CR=1 FL=1